MADAVIAPAGGVQPARARDGPSNFKTESDPDIAPASDDAPNDDTGEAKHPPTSRKLVTGQIDIDAATGRWIIQAISENTGAVVVRTPSEVELKIREYAGSGSAALPHMVSRKV